jgi:hypothetical protein
METLTVFVMETLTVFVMETLTVFVMETLTVFVMETLTVFFDVPTGRVRTTELNTKLFASVHFSVSRNVGNYQ